MPEFDFRDPSQSAFWTERFERSYTPWDVGGVPAALRQYVSRSATSYTALIPGCGTGYEVAFFSEAGWDVTAIDFSPAAVAAARATIGPWAARITEADFFAFTPPKPVDFIYERAFLCALPRRLWPDVAARWARLLPSGGLLAGFFFFDDALKGPPIGIAQEELEALLLTNFVRITDEPVSDSLPVFAGKERWQIWQRLSG